MTYTQVHKILEGDEATRAQFAPLVPTFERMQQLAEFLNKSASAAAPSTSICPSRSSNSTSSEP